MKNDDFCGIFRKRLQKIPFKQLTKAVFRVRIINAVMRKRGIPPFLRVLSLSFLRRRNTDGCEPAGRTGRADRRKGCGRFRGGRMQERTGAAFFAGAVAGMFRTRADFTAGAAGEYKLLSLNCVRAISRNIFPNSYKEVAENAYH